MRRKLTLIGLMAGVAMAASCKKTPEVVEAPVPLAPPAQCAVAEAYLKDRLGRFQDKAGIVVIDAQPQTPSLAGMSVADFVHSYNPSEPEPFGWQDPPSTDLAQVWLAGPKYNALSACPALPATVTAAGVALGKAGDRPKRDDKRLRIAISMPVTSEAGDEALLAEVGRHPLGAAQTIVHLRKDAAGGWKEASTLSFVPGFELPEIPDAPPPIDPLPKKK